VEVTMLLGARTSWILCNVAGFVFPAYNSFKVMRSDADPKSEKDAIRKKQMASLTYWLIFALFCAVEPALDFFVFWLPFYYEAKFALVLWLGAFNGAEVLYSAYVKEFLSSREALIDSYFDKYYDAVVNFQLYDLRHVVYFLQDKYIEYSTGKPAPKRTGSVVAKAKAANGGDKQPPATAAATGATKEAEAADDSPTSEPEVITKEEIEQEPKKDK